MATSTMAAIKLPSINVAEEARRFTALHPRVIEAYRHEIDKIGFKPSSGALMTSSDRDRIELAMIAAYRQETAAWTDAEILNMLAFLATPTAIKSHSPRNYGLRAVARLLQRRGLATLGEVLQFIKDNEPATIDIPGDPTSVSRDAPQASLDAAPREQFH